MLLRATEGAVQPWQAILLAEENCDFKAVSFHTRGLNAGPITRLREVVFILLKNPYYRNVDNGKKLLKLGCGTGWQSSTDDAWRSNPSGSLQADDFLSDSKTHHSFWDMERLYHVPNRKVCTSSK